MIFWVSTPCSGLNVPTFSGNVLPPSLGLLIYVITSASSQTNSVNLNMTAVHSSGMPKQVTNTRCKNPKAKSPRKSENLYHYIIVCCLVVVVTVVMSTRKRVVISPSCVSKWGEVMGWLRGTRDRRWSFRSIEGGGDWAVRGLTGMMNNEEYTRPITAPLPPPSISEVTPRSHNRDPAQNAIQAEMTHNRFLYSVGQQIPAPWGLAGPYLNHCTPPNACYR